jgi:CIC family chloride channel protein
MAPPPRSILAQQFDLAVTSCRDGWQVLRHRGPSQIQFWFIALGIGIAAGFAALAFRKGITALQGFLYGATDIYTIHSFAETLPWYVLLGSADPRGLVVGLILHHFTPDGRVRSVADVIEGAALHDGRVEMRAGLASALASLITLSSGGSSGREGPVVHLAGVISTWVSRRISADGITGRDLLGCAVAAAVSASFNAPIAGTIFALEVVLRHFAVHAFAPIAIAAVAGTVVNRLEFGDVTEFTLTPPARAAILCRTARLPAPRPRVGADRGGADARDLLGRGRRQPRPGPLGHSRAGCARPSPGRCWGRWRSGSRIIIGSATKRRSAR